MPKYKAILKNKSKNIAYGHVYLYKKYRNNESIEVELFNIRTHISLIRKPINLYKISLNKSFEKNASIHLYAITKNNILKECYIIKNPLLIAIIQKFSLFSDKALYNYAYKYKGILQKSTSKNP